MKTLKEFFTGRSNNVTDKLNYRNSNNVAANEVWYQCPMKCEGDKMYNKPGNCPVCNMKLVSVPAHTHEHSNSKSHNHNHHGCC